MLKKMRKQMTTVFLVVVVFFVLALLVDFGGALQGRGRAPDAMRAGSERVGYETLERFSRALEDDLRARGSIPEDEISRRALREAVRQLENRLLALALADRLGLSARDEEIARRVALAVGRTEQGYDPRRVDDLRKQLPASQWRAWEAQAGEEISFRKAFEYLTAGVLLPEEALRGYYELRYRPTDIRHEAYLAADFVPETAARAEYESRRDSFVLPPRATFSVLAFAAPGGDAVAARRKAFLAQARLLAGTPFEVLFDEIASDTDPGTDAQRFEEVPRARLGPFDSAVWYGRLGVPSPVVDAGNGVYAIVLPVARYDTRTQTFEEVSEEIRRGLAGPAERRAAHEAARAAAAAADSPARLSRALLLPGVLPGILSPSTIEDSAVLDHLEKYLSAEDRDPAGNPVRVLDPEVERTLAALRPGEVSGVVETSSGFHLLRLEDRRPAEPEGFVLRAGPLRAALGRILRGGFFEAGIQTAKERWIEVRLDDYLRERLAGSPSRGE